MQNSKLILSVARIWGFLSLAFLCFFLIAHIFGDETMVFSSKKELFAFLFFPLGIVLALFVSYRSALTGGMISVVCILVILILLPELIINPYFLFSVSPGILFLIYGILKEKQLTNK